MEKGENDIYNIGSGKTNTINQILSIIENHSGKKANKRYIEKQKGDVNHTWADITKAKEVLGYGPEIDITEGLKRCIDWFKTKV